MALTNFAYDLDPVEAMALMLSNNGELRYLMSVGTGRGTDHVVCCRGDKVERDPSPNEGPLHRNSVSGLTWVHYLTPLL